MRARLDQSVLLVLLAAALGAACKDVPIDDERKDARLFAPRGVIRGTVTYDGPRPCSKSGHIVGNAIVLVFDRRNPPPPAGVASSAVNFVAVPGDVLFANEPRSTGGELFCPTEPAHITASAPFTIAPLDGASYMVSAFYDRRGRFSPSFKFRNQPEAGDVAGGYIDLEDFQKNGASPTYQPIFLPVNVGTKQNEATAPEIPDFVIGPNGFVADNVPVTLGAIVPFTRPTFHPEGAEDLPDAQTSDANQTGDPLAVPIVAMTQDVHVLAPPSNPTPETLAAYQGSFRSIKLVWGVAPGEDAIATDPAQPFGLQLPPLPPKGKGGLLVFARGGAIPENPLVPALWPAIAFVKLADDPYRTAAPGTPRPLLPLDPQSAVVQGTPQETVVTGAPIRPIVVLTAITLDGDSLAQTIAGGVASTPTTAALRDHVTALLRPAVLCYDPRRVDLGAVLVTPFATGRSADASETGDRPLFDQAALAKQPGVREVEIGCLPTGRYAIDAVYPTGQAWTVPNEMGTCASTEGVPSGGDPVVCSTKPRPVLLSQGARAVLEIVSAQDPSVCAEHPVPDACLHL
jgi:hypothetical protein